MNNRFPPRALMAALLFAVAPAHAERADREKPVNLEADSVEVNDVTRISTYLGNVRLSQGTLLILADKLVVKQDAEGFSHATAHGNPVQFKQKREGIDEYIEGESQRLEYDSRKEKVDLYSQARVKRNQDEVRGSHISYDGKTEFFQVRGGKDAVSDYNPKGRVRAVLQPRAKTSAPASADGVRLKPADSVNRPD